MNCFSNVTLDIKANAGNDKWPMRARFDALKFNSIRLSFQPIKMKNIGIK